MREILDEHISRVEYFDATERSENVTPQAATDFIVLLQWYVVLPIAEIKTLHNGKCWYERTENLRCSRDLPVEVSATDRHAKGVDTAPRTAFRCQNNVLPIKTKLGNANPEAFCSAHKLREVWDGKNELVVEPNMVHFEEKGADSSKKSL
jgi:hypothetical protein